MFTRSFFPAFISALSFCIFFIVAFSSFRSNQNQNLQVGQQVQQVFLRDLEELKQQAEILSKTIRLLEQKRVKPAAAQEAFIRFKESYKKTEYLIEYINPGMARKLNSGPIPKVVVDNGEYQSLGLEKPMFETLPPVGMQVLEEVLFAEEEEIEAGEAYLLADKMLGEITLFQNTLYNLTLSDKQILEGMREELIRIMTMGISGFDSPAAGHEMEAAASALQPLISTTHFYANATNGRAKDLSRKAAKDLQAAFSYLREHKNFDNFDRAHFIRNLADPAYASLTALQLELLPEVSVRNSYIVKPVNNKASGLFSKDFLIPGYYAKQDRQEPTREMVELGKTLFFDPVLSSNNQRACASCHSPNKAFTDGQAQSLAFDFQGKVGRNSPTLLNSIFATAYFWDSRAGFLEDQIPFVVSKADELHTSYEEMIPKLNQSTEYRKLFKKAFADQTVKGLNANTINRAIAAYLRTLVALDSPFDKYMRRETEQIPEAAKRGFNLFTGKAACATCHFAPLFNGTVPPKFIESESEILGVPVTANFAHATLDKDLGRAGVVPAEAWNNAFKTPTVRNVAATAPYMHNGALGTLEEVLEFYDLGGGTGLGLDVPNQTLPGDKLNLTEQEKKDLIAFMESLTDTTATVNAAPKKLPEFPKGSVLNNRVVGGNY